MRIPTMCRAHGPGTARRVPVTPYSIGAAGLEDGNGAFLERYGIVAEGAVLVRPDGYVAWRSRSCAGTGALPEVLACILNRS